MRCLPAVSLGLILALGGSLAAPVPALGAEYSMQTAARFEVQPDAGRVAVSVDATFTNTTPDPPGQFSVFDAVLLAVHDEATDVAATDAEGPLEVSVAREGEVNVARVQLRGQLRFEQSTAFTLTYQLPDSDGGQVRVRPSTVVFPAWGFGTTSEVTVVLPAGYAVTVDGDGLTRSSESGEIVLSSGPIADPTRWLALVSAEGEAAFIELSASVPLSGGTVDLRVRGFDDDRTWAERTLALLERALPLLEERIGLPYAGVGPLVIREAIGTGSVAVSEGESSADEIRVAFDQPPFTVLHQAAHAWIHDGLVADRWIAEGVASHHAAAVAADLEVSSPLDPAAEASALSAAAFPLATWPEAPGADQRRYGYAASWALVNELAAQADTRALADVLRRVAAGVDPYAPPQPTEVSGAAGGEVTPLTSRAFLDHLETLTGAALSASFAQRVLSSTDVELLPARDQARAAYALLSETAGDWGGPEPVRTALGAWEFDAAEARIRLGLDWLAERDRLVAEMSEAGLAPPDRLRDAWRVDGGGPDARSELAAERAVVQAYALALRRVNAERSILERVGLAGGPDPGRELAAANGAFTSGDLRGATDAIVSAERIMSSAATMGVVRVASVLLLLALAVAVIVLVVRMRRVAEPAG